MSVGVDNRDHDNHMVLFLLVLSFPHVHSISFAHFSRQEKAGFSVLLLLSLATPLPPIRTTFSTPGLHCALYTIQTFYKA